jgi:hypothetical protein
MRLFEAGRHEALSDLVWDEAAARAAISRIVRDVHDAYLGEDGLWPIHPIDVSDERPEVLKPLYYGAGGVVWALERLRATGFAVPQRDYRPAVRTLLERSRADALRLNGHPQFSYPTGETGLLLLHWTLEPSETLAAQLEAAIAASQSDPSLGFLWGAPGAMLAALFMAERTGDARWSALCRRLADDLWDRWGFDEVLGCHLWTHDLYGHQEKQLGALHGFAGVAFVLLRCGALLGDRQHELTRRVRQTLRATALRDGTFANWPLIAGPTEHPGAANIRVQHCTGAPGMINALGALPPEPQTDELLLAGGELTWTAGPLAKLPSLCHGVPGSGYAFLKLHQRTGDDIWLSRARRFAMHAIGQADRGLAQYGQRKYSLWTGDVGLALYLWDSVRVSSAFPMMDVF